MDIKVSKRNFYYGLMYEGERKNNDLLVGYVDSGYARDLDNRRSLLGNLFTVNNCTFSWKATLQSVISLSITEVEYIATTETFKEIIWLKSMLKKLEYYRLSVIIFCDS